MKKGNIYAIPVIHYNMESAAQVRLACEEIQPDCIAVELAETMSLKLLHAASRLPDISVVITYDINQSPIYYLSEPCDPAFEGLRYGLESNIRTFCIDLDVDFYPDIKESLPDPYAIHRIGLDNYYELFCKSKQPHATGKWDNDREMYMAKRLKELSFSFERIVFVVGMSHLANVLSHLDSNSFPVFYPAEREAIELCTLTDESTREVMAECGWISTQYEELREEFNQQPNRLQHADSSFAFPPDRQKLIYNLYKKAAVKYTESTGNAFLGYHMRNMMKFMRNYALINNQLMPDLFQIIHVAKACVDHNYAYEVWELATTYPYRKNIDNLLELDLSIEQIWGHSKKVQFHLKQRQRKDHRPYQKRPDKSRFKFQPPTPFGICSYPPEDLIIENYGSFLKKKGMQILTEEAARSAPFATSVEDGLDIRETIRHWHEKKIYVKINGKPPGAVGSVVMIFHEDHAEEGKDYQEKYPWKTTWTGEHQQESDMAFYATPLGANVVGPGIGRCEYGGFMMSYPPRRIMNIWNDPDYHECKTKAECLLMAAIDYSLKPVIVYVAAKPPRSAMKSFASRYGRKIVFIPIGQLSPVTLNKLRVFHVLDGHGKREIAGDYIF